MLILICSGFFFFHLARLSTKITKQFHFRTAQMFCSPQCTSKNNKQAINKKSKYTYLCEKSKKQIWKKHRRISRRLLPSILTQFSFFREIKSQTRASNKMSVCSEILHTYPHHNTIHTAFRLRALPQNRETNTDSNLYY